MSINGLISKIQNMLIFILEKIDIAWKLDFLLLFGCLWCCDLICLWTECIKCLLPMRIYTGIDTYVYACMCALIYAYRNRYVYLYKDREVCVGMWMMSNMYVMLSSDLNNYIYNNYLDS